MGGGCVPVHERGRAMKFFSFLVRNAAPTFAATSGQWYGGTGQTGEYLRYARAYTTNEIIYASIDLLADSAGEPQIVGRRYRRESPRPMTRTEMRTYTKNLVAKGLSYRAADERMIRNGFYEKVPNHPLVKLLNHPNPLTSMGQFWGTMVMDRYIAGNAYALKVRYQDGPLRGKVAELWRLRPDRVRIIPKAGGIDGYEYSTGTEKIVYPADDVVHFKERHPLNDYYGLSPIAVIFERLAIDENMRGFLRTFYESGGTGPGAVLSVKQKLTQDQKDQIRERYKQQFGTTTGFHHLMVIDANEHTYTPLGLNRGLRDALPTEIDGSQEARTAMVFRIPGSIIGLRIGYESSSYANKRQDWQVFWDLTMTPLLSDMDDTLCLTMIHEFGGIDEVCFDLGDIRALQEDVDKVQERHRKNFALGGISWEEFREGIGFDPELGEGTLLIPSNMTPISIQRLEDTAETEPEPPQIPAPPQEPQMDIVAEVHCPHCNRWIGRNLNVGGEAYCPQHKGVPVVGAEPKLLSISVVRDEDGKVTSLVGEA